MGDESRTLPRVMRAPMWWVIVVCGCACEPSAPAPTTPTASTPPATTLPPTPAPPAPSPTPTTSSTVAPSSAAPWSGAWASPNCGDREYPRWVTLEDGGKLVGQERISPCPPNVACVWSGIIPWTGRWSEAEGRITLTIDPVESNPAMKPLPAALTWDAKASVLVEPHDGEPCRYQRRGK